MFFFLYVIDREFSRQFYVIIYLFTVTPAVICSAVLSALVRQGVSFNTVRS